MKEIERISEIKESLIWVEEISWKLTEPELLDKILLTMVSAQKKLSRPSFNCSSHSLSWELPSPKVKSMLK